MVAVVINKAFISAVGNFQQLIGDCCNESAPADIGIQISCNSNIIREAGGFNIDSYTDNYTVNRSVLKIGNCFCQYSADFLLSR